MKTIRMTDDWKFIKENVPNAQNVDFDDSAWRTVKVPHDYAVEGPFDIENDKQVKEVFADGILTPMIHTARTGGLPINDPAWYRKTFTVSDDAKRVYIEFDGVMCYGTIYVNGQEVYHRPYGYASFSVDVTDYIEKGKENLLAVSTAPKPCASRWYPGAGIYRYVRLVEKSDVLVPYNGTYVVSTVDGDNAKVCVETTIENFAESKEVELQTEIFAPNGEVVATATVAVGLDETVVKQTLDVANAELWAIYTPKMYKVVSTVKVAGEKVDVYETPFGIRTLEYKKDEGFFLNGKYTKLNGVCLHHDHGPLGAAYNHSAMRRQIEIMIDMGVNSIRTSHNPPAPGLLDLCDEMGIVVLDEAFDEWKLPKVDNGYFLNFDEWAEIDWTSQIMRDRNHPCVIMWSVGNEMMDQHDPKEGAKTTRFLCDICREYDPTRPTTAGFNNPDPAIANGLVQEVDIAGFNYKPHRYTEFKEAHPEWTIYGSETESCTSSRGKYYLPVERECPAIMRDDYHATAYDMAGPVWAYPPEKEFGYQDDLPYVLGEFVWTGFDYLGEPTPYREEWPSRSSYFGIVDLVGLKKDRFYSYQAKWTDKDVIHLFPHWNWEKGQKVPVHCYSSFDKVELFLNGKSLGIATTDKTDEIKRYRLIWDDVDFEEGELKAVAVDKPEVFDVVRTAGKACKLVATPEKTEILANDEDLCYIRIDVVDENGVICPEADNKIEFAVTGVGNYVASDAGDQTSLRIFHETWCDAFSGCCMAIVKASEVGTLTLEATSTGLESTSVSVEAK